MSSLITKTNVGLVVAALLGIYLKRFSIQKAAVYGIFKTRVLLLKLRILRPNLEGMYGDAVDPAIKPSHELNALTQIFIEVGKQNPPSIMQTAEGTRNFCSGFYKLGLFGPLFSSEQYKKLKIGGVPCYWITHPNMEKAPGAPKDGVILYCHGGGYHAGSLDTYGQVCGELSRRTGCKVLFVDYTLCPKAPISKGRDELVAAYEHILLDTSATNVALVGDSAGGGFVMGVMQAIRSKNLNMPACGVLLSPWADITNKSVAMNNNTCDCLFPNLEFFTSLADECVSLSGKPAADPENSFLNGGFKYFPPCFVCVGKTERLLDDTLTFIERAKSDGVKVTSEVAPYSMHIYPILYGFRVPEYTETLDRICKFIQTNVSN
mmetsp:Transcript_16340/g.31732  ORF Transcript_16340/g.31732 Transcript_16340/m.31732 type:complete len:377 (+) Transcript_16340:154-1284(+)|eukprot:CAMPEP_0171493642 /NCGR_PEP_ID=MMETSP0958-20121227/5076_1 /TAXON_ID=87120 /ORGANISM="Aurantiochytrium limacinum, Strain ATCCMYA-1381" /LENGTH=376 /DNA_ID=CAMNT_0012027289 /DNA_START=88 /DNA_END=1218 /DNA_ORIENTATION=-